jgi:hypothetical protein
MPIKVTCACGQSFAAKDELAGRTVKCPKCGRPLAIPAAGGAGTVPASPLVPQPAPAPAAAPAGSYQPSGLFDEVGISSTPVGTQPCPGCRAPMPMQAVVCVQCGYNLKLGRRMETMRMGADGQMGPGSVVETVLARAAQALEDEKEEERKKTREGLPWWAYLVMLLGVLGFLALMMLIPQQNAIMVAAVALMFLGWLICVYSGVCILVTAFRESPLQGILCLLCGPYQLVYIIMRWDQCAGFFFMNLGGSVIIGVGMGVLMLGEMIGSGDEEAKLPRGQRATVVVEQVV